MWRAFVVDLDQSLQYFVLSLTGLVQYIVVRRTHGMDPSPRCRDSSRVVVVGSAVCPHSHKDTRVSDTH